jgi:hypothetical protein
VYFRIRAR